MNFLISVTRLLYESTKSHFEIILGLLYNILLHKDIKLVFIIVCRQEDTQT